MIAAINYLNTFNNSKIIIFGEIGELGKFSKKIHSNIAKYLTKFYWYCDRFWSRNKIFEFF